MTSPRKAASFWVNSLLCQAPWQRLLPFLLSSWTKGRNAAEASGWNLIFCVISGSCIFATAKSELVIGPDHQQISSSFKDPPKGTNSWHEIVVMGAHIRKLMKVESQTTKCFLYGYLMTGPLNFWPVTPLPTLSPSPPRAHLVNEPAIIIKLYDTGLQYDLESRVEM